MRPTSTESAGIFAAAKIHKFADFKEINIDDLCHIIKQTGTH